MHRRLALLTTAALTAAGASGAVPAPASAAPTAAAEPAASAPAAVPDELLVGYVAGATSDDRARARGRASARFLEQVVAASGDRKEVELVVLPAGKDRGSAISQLRSDPAVAYAEPNWIYTRQTVTDPYYTSTDTANDLWGMYGDATEPANQYGSQAGEAWPGNTGSAEVYIGVIDEGIQFNHPDLNGKVHNPLETGDSAQGGTDDDGNGYVDDVHGWDFVNNDNTVYDGGLDGSLDNHGTHVAGTIGANANSEGVVGVSWDVSLISGKFLGENGGTLANAVKAVDYFTHLKTAGKVNIIATNNSWGGGGYSQSLLDAIVRGAQAQILFVAAAGNGGTNNDKKASYPSNYDTTSGAGYDAVIAVAAIDRNGKKPRFSQYGAKTVDLGAPGVGVWSTTAYDGYSKYSGTSMATPHVTGGAALYKAAYPDATAAQVKAAVLDAAKATPTESLKGKTVTGGRLNVSGFVAPAS
jgi:subtilisin family serine protease